MRNTDGLRRLYLSVISNDDPMFKDETESVWLNTNNNIAWKNVSILDLDPNNFQCPDESISVFVNDVDNVLTPISRPKKIIKSLNKRYE